MDKLDPQRPRRVLPAALLALALASCGLIPEKVAWDDPRLVPLLRAVEAVDRASLGFSPIDRASSTVRLESRPRAGYDAMLHIDGRPVRTIAFRKTAEGYRWIHEQEIFTGPKTYDTPDGNLQEQIVITYGLEPVSGHAANQVHVEYWGEDPRLPAHRPLTLAQVAPILADWKKSIQ